MKIVKLMDHKIESVVAGVYKNNKNNKLYYMIRYGDLNVPNVSKMYTISIDTKIDIPSSITDTIELLDNDYVLKPIVNKRCGKVTNKRGEQLYTLTKQPMDYVYRDLLVFWSLPVDKYPNKNIVYSIEGDVRLIAEACYAKDRGNIIYSAPAPVLEIYGDCRLAWEGTSIDNIKKGQVIEYKMNSDKFVFEII